MTIPAKTTQDYRDTVFLPKTDFPMKAGLPEKEPRILAKWQADDIYGQLRAARKGRETFILHDGPPYANGDIHIGHAMQKTLKDLVVRTQSLLGKDAPFVPGWDCHGLPIEWKVEEEYRKAKRNKDEVPVAEFRAECRAYAQKWVDIQREQFKRLGIGGRWDKPYLTMDASAEAVIVTELLKFAMTDQVYRGAKPVMWSPVEKTALAEAEVEYADVVSTQIDVAFEIKHAPNNPKLVGAFAVVWTTTPWTIPVNQAIAFNPQYEDENFDEFYAVYRTRDDKRLLLSSALISDFCARTGINDLVREEFISPKSLDGATALHPLHFLGGFFEMPRRFLPGEFVTFDAGTGLVHMAPDHGEDDFALCKANGIAPVFAVTADGTYRTDLPDWLWLQGQGNVISDKLNNPEGAICTALRDAGALLAAAPYAHSYPHSWRSKKKVIYRCTPQWFIAMDTPNSSPEAREMEGPAPAWAWEGEGSLAAVRPSPSHRETAAGPSLSRAAGEGQTLRTTAMAAIAATRFIPERGRNRLGSMVADRPDWVISRQRAWGVPITLFVDRASGQYLKDPAVNARIIAAVAAGGVDAWNAESGQTLLGSDYTLADYEQVTDILDVWFDSGCTHAFVLESGNWPELSSPADLYLEGSDQHRGWFQSSLLESCGTRGRAPYKAVLTHGMTLDAKGFKQSKSVGNTTDPDVVLRDYGADIIRLWTATSDTTEDHRIGDEILKGVADQYRKLRNTFRYLLGALDGFTEAERVAPVDMPELERWVLHRLAVIDVELRRAVDDFDFSAYVSAISTFINTDLSAFVFDVRKDVLYCDAATEPKRRAYRSVLDTLFHALARWLAPVLVFTTEEVWATRFSDGGSVHLLEWPKIAAGWRDDALGARIARVRLVRDDVYLRLEALRRDKTLGSFLEAGIDIQVSDEDRFVELSNTDLAEMLIVGRATVQKTTGHDGLVVGAAGDPKCARCWRHLPDVAAATELCGRCTAVAA